MSIVEALKNLVGYSGNDYDHIFALIAMFVVLYFLSVLFSILTSIFDRRR